jgi:hypothetical protein
MSLWNWLSHEADSVAHEVSETAHEAIGSASSGMHAVGDTLGSIDESIEAIPVVGTIYDLTPVHSAVSLGHEWANVGAELGDDVGMEMEGKHANWGHLGRQALAAGVDTGITVASSYLGGKAAGKVLGTMAGSAEKVGMRAAGRDIAGDLGAGGAKSWTRRGADYAAHTAIGGSLGASAVAPARAMQQGAGISFDDRPHNVAHRAMNYGDTVERYNPAMTQAYATGNEQQINHIPNPQIGHVEGFQSNRGI